jgi:hypothetical protein
MNAQAPTGFVRASATTRAPKDSDYKCDPWAARCAGFASICFELFLSYWFTRRIGRIRYVIWQSFARAVHCSGAPTVTTCMPSWLHRRETIN